VAAVVPQAEEAVEAFDASPLDVPAFLRRHGDA
jgi:hypothetical protein